MLIETTGRVYEGLGELSPPFNAPKILFCLLNRQNDIFRLPSTKACQQPIIFLLLVKKPNQACRESKSVSGANNCKAILIISGFEKFGLLDQMQPVPLLPLT